jgi:uncharacterized protein YuzE
MKITYDPEGDILHFRLREGAVMHSEPVLDQEDIVIDYDEEDCLIGIEMMNASDLLGGTPASIEFALPTPSRRN